MMKQVILYVVMPLICLNHIKSFSFDNNDICVVNTNSPCNSMHKFKCDPETCAIKRGHCILYNKLKRYSQVELMPFAFSYSDRNINIISEFVRSFRRCSAFDFDRKYNRNIYVPTNYCNVTKTCFRMAYHIKTNPTPLARVNCKCEYYLWEKDKHMVACPNSSNICGRDLNTCANLQENTKNESIRFTCNKYSKISVDVIF